MIHVSAWEDDPQSAPAAQPCERPAPALEQRRLGVAIAGPKPAARVYQPGSAGFRYWNAADSLTRAAQYWAGRVPSPVRWQTGAVLPAVVDAGVDLNAYYDRRQLCFFHAKVGGLTVYSGESPDVLCHELGHAVLDALVPALWNAAAIEVAALHEAFGDISAMLSALELSSVRAAVLRETDGRLSRSSRVSRLAEQLGWAVRQVRPDAVETDCLRNAANSFFYSAPEKLPPMAPATSLSSEPHSFSRVFTAAWLDGLAGMVSVVGPSPDDLHRATQDAGALLVRAVPRAVIAPNYFAQVAAQIIKADAELHKGRYREPLRRAFVGRVLLSLNSAAVVTTDVSRITSMGETPLGESTRVLRVPVDGETYGLRVRRVWVEATLAEARSVVASAAPDLGSLPAATPERASRAFVEDLLRRHRIDAGDLGIAGHRHARPARTTHALVREGREVRLVRRLFHARGGGGPDYTGGDD